MLTVDLFELLGRFLEVLLLVQQEYGLIVELVRRDIDGRLLFRGEDVETVEIETAAGAERRQRE